jgi:hypothetical protein
MTSHGKSAVSPNKPLPDWLTSRRRCRPPLHVPIWTRLMRALQVSKRQAPRPMPWHPGLTHDIRRIKRPGNEGPKPNND